MTQAEEIADWAGSGAMALTGRRGGPPQLVAGAPATAVRKDLEALSTMANAIGLDTEALPDERLLSERAAIMGLRRQGSVSAGGATRILRAADAEIAVTLSRPCDVDLLPALIERGALSADPWHDLTTWATEHHAADIAERGALLGLAIGTVDHTLPEANLLGLSTPLETPKRLASTATPMVVDLSALWAGPLCAHLLGRLGARVIAVESDRRPDPTRAVAPDFHRMLREGTEHLTLDFTDANDLARLRDLLAEADIVIEASRPRALAQLGIDAETFAKTATWLSITAYGREANRIGYGDDVAAAAGLLGAGPVFAGDALADPLTGTRAAATALARWSTDQPGLAEIDMYDAVRAARTPIPDAAVVRSGEDWAVDDGTRLIPVLDPAVRAGSR